MSLITCLCASLLMMPTVRLTLNSLWTCVGDSTKWDDFDLEYERPFALKPVVIGFDPARFGDKASVAVLSAPMKPGEKFRLLEAVDLSGNDFEAMAAEIKLLTEKYNVATHWR